MRPLCVWTFLFGIHTSFFVYGQNAELAALKKKSRFSGALSYGLSYNELDSSSAKIVNHNFFVGLNYKIKNKLRFSLGTSFFHQTLKEQVYRDNSQEDFHKWSHLSLGLSERRSYKGFSFTQRVGLNFPVSERDRFDQVRFRLSGSQVLSTPSFWRFYLLSMVGVRYSSHRLSHSIYNDGALNSEWAVSFRPALRFRVHKNIDLMVSQGVYFKRFLDKSTDFSFGNGAGVSVALKSLFFDFWVVNNSYQDQNRFDISYYDQHKKIYSLGVGYAF